MSIAKVMSYKTFTLPLYSVKYNLLNKLKCAAFYW